jgi:predicted nucleic acid-binding protein
MARALTIDANVFVSALSTVEVEREESVRFLESLKTKERLLVLPTLVRPEVAGAIARTTGDARAAQRAARLAFLPAPATFITLDERLAAEAADLAASAGLRGADAVYAAVARRFDTILVTLDREVRERLPSSIVSHLPGEVLSLGDLP